MASQSWIAVDQLLNTWVSMGGEGRGFADETLSARAYRLREVAPQWERRINRLIFWQPDHCKGAHQSELERKHLPVAYRLQGTEDR
jgi:hypothetical protein